MKDRELMIEIATKLAEIVAENESIDEEQLVKCVAVTAAFMMAETGICEIETNEFKLEATKK